MAAIGSIVCAVVLALSLAACGALSESPATSDSVLRKDSAPDALVVRSPAIGTDPSVYKWIRERYRCEEEAIWLPLRWDGVPEDTAEIVVTTTVSRLRFRNRTDLPALQSELAGIWVIGGLDAEEHELRPGDPPRGAFIDRHSTATKCPSLAKPSAMQFTVFAMPRGHSVQLDFATSEMIESLHNASLATGSIFALYGGKENFPFGG